MMDEDRFWAIVAESRQQAAKRKARRKGDFLDRQIKELTKLLRGLSPEEVVAYQERFYHVRERAYRWDVWGAAYWLDGGCSDDGFLDFRSCLVSLGREMFEQILADPDFLAEIVDRPDLPYMQSEGFQYVAMKVYEEQTGEVLRLAPPADRPWPYKPKGR